MQTSPAPAPTQVIQPSILYYGTPVALISSLNQDGTSNLAPMSSSWALGETVVLGLGSAGHTAGNLIRHAECVINLPGPHQWHHVERLAPLTGSNPVPPHKAAQFRFEPDKFAAAGLTPLDSDLVAPARVAECPLQLEARIIDNRPAAAGSFHIFEAAVVQVHAHPDVVVAGTNHIDTDNWSPLIYNYRHYFGLGNRLGRTFRAQT